MYNIRYERSDGKALSFSLAQGFIVKSITGDTGYSVDLSISQGYQQVGEMVDSVSIGGQNVVINGFVLDKKTSSKEALLAVFTPLTRGRLYWEDKYYIETYVASSPEISQEKHSKFSLKLFAPFPFWKSVAETSQTFGSITPLFSFPVNYAEPHTFGMRSRESLVNCLNNGNVPIDFQLEISSRGSVVNPRVSNLTTEQFVSFTGEIESGEKLIMRRTNGELEVLISDGRQQRNAFDMLDVESDFFMLAVGDNVLNMSADSGQESAFTFIKFSAAKAGVLANGV